MYDSYPGSASDIEAEDFKRIVAALVTGNACHDTGKLFDIARELLVEQQKYVSEHFSNAHMQFAPRTDTGTIDRPNRTPGD